MLHFTELANNATAQKISSFPTFDHPWVLIVNICFLKSVVYALLCYVRIGAISRQYKMAI